VSKAKPMAIGRRLAGYQGDGTRLTGPQWRRHKHKYARKYGQPLYGSSGKRQPTPRQRKTPDGGQPC
jgi:hypothetical protein